MESGKDGRSRLMATTGRSLRLGSVPRYIIISRRYSEPSLRCSHLVMLLLGLLYIVVDDMIYVKSKRAIAAIYHISL